MLPSKTVLGVTAILLALTLSCQQESEVEVASPTVDISTMDDLDDQVHLMSIEARQAEGLSETRSFWSFLRNLCRVVSSDASGAVQGYKDGKEISFTGGLIGAAVVGVTSSIETAIDIWGPDEVQASITSATSSPSVSGYDCGGSVTGSRYGELHNRAIAQIADRCDKLDSSDDDASSLCVEAVDTAWEEISDESSHSDNVHPHQVYPSSIRRNEDAVAPEVPDYEEGAIDVFLDTTSGQGEESNRALLRRNVDTVKRIASESETVDDLKHALVSDLSFSEEEASIMTNYVVTISSLSLSSAKEYARNISNLIRSAKVDEEAKERLSVFVSVGSSSRVLWDGMED